MLSAFNIYRDIPRHILYLLLAEFCLQMVNSAFFLLLNYYMVDQGFDDPTIADMVSYRFLMVMVLAFPLGLLIKGRHIKPFFLAACILSPLMATVTIWAIGAKLSWLVYLGLSGWGVSFMGLHVTAMPYILLNSDQKYHSNAIALFFQTWSVSMILVGSLSYLLNHNLPQVFNHRTLLFLFAGISFLGTYFITRINIQETVSEPVAISKFRTSYDWPLIIRVLIPTLIIATGAGFTIPFINLFFLKVHGVQEDTFSLMGAFTYGLVALGVLYVPAINKRFGYGVSIVLIQAMAVVALVAMATTEFYNNLWFAAYVAITFYIIRQPLMNLAGPMTSELTMYYVGKRNRELISALNASIWSGSWYFSSQIFRVLRANEQPYAVIFLITAALYTLGILWYAYLIRDFKKRKAAGLIEV